MSSNDLSAALLVPDGAQEHGEATTECTNEQTPRTAAASYVERLFNNYMGFVKRFRYQIVAFWAVFLVVSSAFGADFLTMGDDNMTAPKGTRAEIAQTSFNTRFKVQSEIVPVLVLIQQVHPDFNVLVPELTKFHFDLLDKVGEYNATHHNVVNFESWYGYNGTVLDDIKVGFVNNQQVSPQGVPFGNASFINIGVTNKNITSRRYDFANWLEDAVADLNPNPARFTIGVTGFDAMAAQNTATTKEQVEKIDMFTMPIAFLLLAFMVRSWRLLLIAMMNMIAGIMGGFAIMVMLIKLGCPHPESATSQLMEVMALAMSIDYSLFLGRRFRDECKMWVPSTPGADDAHGNASSVASVSTGSGDDDHDVEHQAPAPAPAPAARPAHDDLTDEQVVAKVDHAVYQTMRHAGEVVFMSAATITVVFVCFGFLPARSLKMDGAACAIAILLCLCVNLTNTPALLFIFPRFFSTFNGVRGYLCDDSKRQYKHHYSAVDRRNMQDQATADTYMDLQDTTEDLQLTKATDHVHPMYRGFRFRLTKKVTAWPYNLICIVVLYVLVIPLAIQINHIDVNENVLGAMSRHSSASIRLRSMVNTFSGGTFSPFYILINAPDYRPHVIGTHGKLNGNVFDISHEIYQRTVNTTTCNWQDPAHPDAPIKHCQIVSPTVANGKTIGPLMSKGLLAAAKLCKDTSKLAACREARAYQYLWEHSVNPRGTSMVITVMVPFFPFARDSATFIDDVHEIIDDIQARYDTPLQDDQIEIHLAGFDVGYDALMELVYGLFPVLIIVTCVAVFVVLGVLLRSYFVPIRLAATLLLPLASVFGLAVLVYQDGILEWTGLAALQRADGFFWYIPILVCTMVIGLALDYDIFLITRIMEHRSKGYDIRAAITKAVCETGGTIASAGIIMTLAFGGMLISDQATVNQCGWLLMTAVLLDTFVVNTLLVPALMSFGDKIAWAPTKMPMENLITLDDLEFPQD